MELKQWHGFCLCPLVFLVRRDPLRSRGLFAVTVLDEVFEAETAGVLLPPAQGTTPAEPLREFVAANGACVLNSAFSAAFSVLERWHRKRTQPLRGVRVIDAQLAQLPAEQLQRQQQRAADVA